MTLLTLADNLARLLDFLDISNISILVGLGLGASIALKFLEHHRLVNVSAFIGVSFPIPTTSPSVKAAVIRKWQDRISLARRFGMDIIGHKACSRWFSADARNSPEWVRIQRMVASGGCEDMANLSHAVLESWGVGMTDGEAKDCGRSMFAKLEMPVFFLCGAGDNEFPETMAEYPSLVPPGRGQFKIIARAARLACVERPGEFVSACHDFGFGPGSANHD